MESFLDDLSGDGNITLWPPLANETIIKSSKGRPQSRPTLWFITFEASPHWRKVFGCHPQLFIGHHDHDSLGSKSVQIQTYRRGPKVLGVSVMLQTGFGNFCLGTKKIS